MAAQAAETVPDVPLQSFFRWSTREEFESQTEAMSVFGDVNYDLPGDTSRLAFTKLFSAPILSQVNERSLFSTMKRWASEAYDGLTFRATLHSNEKQVLTAAACRRILANAFFNNVLDVVTDGKTKIGGVSIKRLVNNTAHARNNDVGFQKLACLILYFNCGIELEHLGIDEEREVTFHRVLCPNAQDFYDFIRTSDKPCTADNVVVHDGRMEETPDFSHGFFNFANKNFGYGTIIPSCTQEEILITCCPEFMVGMLFIGKMTDHEVVNVYQCRRFTTYTGYLDSFECTGTINIHNPVLHDIVTADACYMGHFETSNQVRDTRKAYTAFQALAEYYNPIEGQPPTPPTADDGEAGDDEAGVGGPPEGGPAAVDKMAAWAPEILVSVSSGKWGCGVFGGHPSHKFVQQVLAATLAGVRMNFSAFGNRERCDELLEHLQSQNKTVGEVWTVLIGESRQKFEDNFKRKLR